VAIAGGALKSFDYTRTGLFAGDAPVCATGARASLLFGARNIGLSG
jgi:hypothetical protein